MEGSIPARLDPYVFSEPQLLALRKIAHNEPIEANLNDSAHEIYVRLDRVQEAARRDDPAARAQLDAIFKSGANR